MASSSSSLICLPLDRYLEKFELARRRLIVKHRVARALRKAEKAFRKANPTYADTLRLDHIRQIDYPVLDKENRIYLDYAGSGIHGESQLQRHFELLRSNVFGNPHSINPTSSAITKLDEQARARVLSFFRADPSEYIVIFTINTSNALKLIGEAYPFTEGGELLLLNDNQPAVIGLRDFARRRGAAVSYLPVKQPELRCDEDAVKSALKRKESIDEPPARLFAFPAQSNFTGVQHPLEWIADAQEQGWHVLLDADNYTPTNILDLSRWHPDFVSVSFYKMFGHPSSVGAVLARREAFAKLGRPWFAGGTVWGSSVQANGHMLLGDNEGFEDGTINFLSLPAIRIGLNHIAGIGMEAIHARVSCLTNWLLKELSGLTHTNGEPLVVIYGPYTSDLPRGGIIALNFVDMKGCLVDEDLVARRAAARNITLHVGSALQPNTETSAAVESDSPDAIQKVSGETQERKKATERRRESETSFNEVGLPTGGFIRISLGLASNFSDAFAFVQFASSFLDTIPVDDARTA
ncbi:Aminotransferase class V-fold PLP-dependent enzyme [Trichophyton interdigitale]|uniref:Aminotransferase class V-fold PLP-dependent enzyme n=1 Tax=Trichophyton interdigitale TaxID=101480 RepID=A0A9P5D0F7_9EURO|nr:Aminotransferase class V-fold PLP-dependent enzyme [Trichophyton interdigitale]KAF3900929.1 Aminotransferase class V-fold PLP-dependent enzyme [Trichophyton interdigitale]KAG8212576.1 Aminotransferase class V-fold PLP-dependent enzyme [Trichophyton interdigitale]